MKKYFLLAAVLLIPGISRSQGFKVISGSPVDGSAGVPLEATIRFQFNGAVSINTDWSTAFLREPRHELALSRIFLGLDDQNRPAVVDFDVQHQPNTDYTWIVYDVRSSSGTLMTEPYVLRYTTAPEIGPFSVSGPLVEAVPTASAGIALRSSLTRLSRIVEGGRTGVEDLEGASEPSAGMMRPAKHAQADTPVSIVPRATWRDASVLRPSATDAGALAEEPTLVFLLENFSTRPGEGEVQHATLAPAGATEYEAKYVRDGTYWPVAVRYAPGTRDVTALGFYDPDGDDLPDSLVVQGGSVSGATIRLFAYERSTVEEYMALAANAAAEYTSDPRLVAIRATRGLTTAGTAHEWLYEYYSPSADVLTSVAVDPLFIQVDTSSASAVAASLKPIGTVEIGSAEAFQIAEANGGLEFRSRFPEGDLIVTAEAGNLYWYFPADTTRLFWRINYVGLGDDVEQFAVLVDLGSGVVLTSSDDSEHLPAALALRPAGPNPFRESTSLRWSMPTAGRAQVAVYNLLGQQVALLADGIFPPGEHTLTWNASGAPSGPYICVLQTEAGRASLMLTRLK